MHKDVRKGYVLPSWPFNLFIVRIVREMKARTGNVTVDQMLKDVKNNWFSK